MIPSKYINGKTNINKILTITCLPNVLSCAYNYGYLGIL